MCQFSKIFFLLLKGIPARSPHFQGLILIRNTSFELFTRTEYGKTPESILKSKLTAEIQEQLKAVKLITSISSNSI